MFGRFLILVLIFVISMGLLILRPNLISLLLGWDGLGVTSYLLVVFYQRGKSYNAGIITALTNRIGDVGLLICIGLIFFFGDWTFLYLRNSNEYFNKILLIVLIMAACTKRAQIPFSAWLPAAMAAPTPVSALVHSSTLVTAGVYLLIRFNFILANFSLSYFLMVLGSFTILMAGIAAILEIDIKKVIALSTLRQLGVIIIILGAQKPLLAYFHLLSHAYFKAILFICAGIIIHNIKDYQDIRIMGRIGVNMPVVLRIINISNLRLCGLPFMRGFYSKDIILEIMLIWKLNLFIIFIILLATFLTVFYSCRLSFFLSSIGIKSERIFFTVDNDVFILGGIRFLFPFAIIGGINLSWIIISYRPVIFMPLWLKSAIIILIFRALIRIIYLFKGNFLIFSSLASIFVNIIWFIPLTFRRRSSKRSFILGKQIIKVGENSWVEIILYLKIFFRSRKIRVYFNSLTTSYFLSFFFISLLLFFLLF